MRPFPLIPRLVSTLVPGAFLAAIGMALAAPGLRAQDGTSDSERNADFVNAQEYTACMTLAQREPEQALGSAESWEQRGGGDAARECQAVALFSLGKYPQAAALFEEVGETISNENPPLAARTLAKAGMAWQDADMYDRALAAQTAALELAPDDVDIWVERSTTQFFLGNCWEALDDLNAASELAPDSADILVLRASAYRCVEAYDLAREDIDRVLQLKPGDPEALLQRGSLRHLSGDIEGARADWLKVAEDAAGTPVADAAQMNLERLDLKTQ